MKLRQNLRRGMRAKAIEEFLRTTGRYSITCSLFGASQSAINSEIYDLCLIDLRSSGRTSVCGSPWRRVVGLQGPSAAAAVLSPIPAGLLQDTLSDRS